MDISILKTLLILGGIGHLGLVLGSFLIPYLLDWKKELSTLKSKLLKNLFWTYSGYILGIHAFFGVLSLIATDDMLMGTSLSLAVTFFIALYWGVRIILQFTYYDRSSTANGFIFKLGEIVLMLLFTFFTFVYGSLFYFTF